MFQKLLLLHLWVFFKQESCGHSACQGGRWQRPGYGAFLPVSVGSTPAALIFGAASARAPLISQMLPNEASH